MKKLLTGLLVMVAFGLLAGNKNPLLDGNLQFVNPTAEQFYAAQFTNAYASNFVYQIAQLISASGISAATGTNIAAYQAYLATSSITSGSGVTVQVTNQWRIDATNTASAFTNGLATKAYADAAGTNAATTATNGLLSKASATNWFLGLHAPADSANSATTAGTAIQASFLKMLSGGVSNPFALNPAGSAIVSWEDGPQELHFLFPIDGSGQNLLNLQAGNITPGGTMPPLNGVNLTNLNASALTSGTVPLSQLPGSVATNTGDNKFSAGQTVGGSVTVTSGQFNGNGSGLTNVWVKQVIPFLIGNATLNTGNRWIAPFGSTANGTSLTGTGPCPVGGYLSNLAAFFNTALPATTNIAGTIQTNKGLATLVSTPLTLTLAPAGGSTYTNSGTLSVPLTAIQDPLGLTMGLLVNTTSPGGNITGPLTFTVEWWHQ